MPGGASVATVLMKYLQDNAHCLILNGVFERVLSEILAAQAKAPTKPHFLQPYSKRKITLLAEKSRTVCGARHARTVNAPRQ